MPRVLTPRSIEFVRNVRARRYVLRVDRHGMVRVTIPRGGSEALARRFLFEKEPWIRAQLERIAAGPQPPRVWSAGTPVWYRGDRHPLVDSGSLARLADLTFPTPGPGVDWRPAVEARLRTLAAEELPHLVREASVRLALPVRRVLVRNQRTRWGSCSRRGTISLNWRLVQIPLAVRDYLILHELAHLREMNHSVRFWRLVESLFPGWREAERWLRKHGRDLLG